MAKKLLIALIVLAAAAAIYVIKNCKCCHPPAPPNPNLEEWWGPRELQGKQDTSIRPFKVEFGEQLIKDLKQRLNSWRIPPPPLEGTGFRYGFSSAHLARVLQHWRDSYDFAARQQLLNRFPQHKTQVQGLDLHYLHVKPQKTERAVLPLLLLHGWPGSVREFHELIPLLTQPAAGRDFVFEVIAPSLPGYGFSSAAVKPGLGAFEVGVVMRNLMQRLGHKQFYIHGGDWGSVIGSAMATVFPNEVLGYHSNMLITMSKCATVKEFLGSFYPTWFVEEQYVDRLYPLSKYFAYLMEELGYMHLQATKPDTVGTALSDSPAGLAAYILEKFSTWTNVEYRDKPDGDLTKKFKLDDLLDNVMIYWATNSITTSMRLYSETFNKRFLELQLDEIPTAVPTWGLKARHELAYQPDSILKDKYTNLLGSTHLDDGGHFVAFEMPREVAEDVFKAVQEFRKFHAQRQKNTEL